jgi:copper chaperone CopZ
MKKLTFILTATILTIAAPAYSNDGSSHSTQVEQAVQSGDAHIRVNGLVCDFCARALEKVFGKEEAVKAIDVNLDTKIITVNFNEGQTLSDEKLTQLITDADYNVESIHRVE